MLKRFIPFLIVAAVAVPARAQGRGGQPPQAPPAAGESAGPREEFAGAAEEKISQTSHTIRVDGREIKYTATAGTLPIRLDNGQVVARVNFTRFSKATSFDFDETLDKIVASAAKFNVDRIKQEDVAKVGGAPPDED